MRVAGMMFICTLVLTSLLHFVTSSSAQTVLTEDERQEIMTLAARIIRLSMKGSGIYTNTKRNAGTVDSLYNLPDMMEIGKRR